MSSLDILLGYPAKSVWDEIQGAGGAAFERRLPGVGKVAVNVTSKVVPHAVQRGVKLVDGVKNIIAVASGKGGVGKSTTAVESGAGAGRRGSEGRHAGCRHLRPFAAAPCWASPASLKSKDGKSMEPMQGHGMQAMSIGFMIDGDDTPMVWRGPMVTQALDQLLSQTQLGRSGLSGGGPAAGHRRHPVDAGAEGAGDRRGDRHHAAGHRADGCAQGAQDVREGRISRSLASWRT